MTPLELKVQQLEERLNAFEKIDRFEFSKNVGFYKRNPIKQPTADTINAATNIYNTSFFADATYGNNEVNQINNMWNAMIGLGLIKEI